MLFSDISFLQGREEGRKEGKEGGIGLRSQAGFRFLLMRFGVCLFSVWSEKYLPSEPTRKSEAQSILPTYTLVSSGEMVGGNAEQ